MSAIKWGRAVDGVRESKCGAYQIRNPFRYSYKLHFGAECIWSGISAAQAREVARAHANGEDISIGNPEAK